MVRTHAPHATTGTAPVLTRPARPGRYSLRVEDANPTSREIVGEVLLTTRRFYSSASISPDRLAFSDSDSDEDAEPSGPVDHGTMPMAPIDEPTLAAVAVAHAGR